MVRDKLLSRVKKKFSGRRARVLFPEFSDPRIEEAWKQLFEEGICEDFFILAEEKAFSPKGEFLKSSLEMEESFLNFSLYAKDLKAKVYETLKQSAEKRGKNWDEKYLKEKAGSPLYQSAFLLAEGFVDCVVAGCSYTTKEVIKAGLELLPKEEGLGTVSSSFFISREGAEGKNFQALYADCGVVIQPDVDDLVSIAESTLASWEHFSFLFPQKKPVLAFLSYATHDSAWDESVERVKKASQVFSKRNPGVLADGPLQFDAAFDPIVRKAKAKDSPLGEEVANVFIFPELNSGNIAYKMAQRLGGCEAYGPLLQGFSLPYSDLSRGASASDIVMTTCLKLLSLSH